MLETNEPEDLFQLIAWQNGPLLDYHPTVLAQCLIWGMSAISIILIVADRSDKLDLVKKILVDLHRSLKESEDAGSKRLDFTRLDPFDFVTVGRNVNHSPKSVCL
jgi:hypothetical protein